MKQDFRDEKILQQYLLGTLADETEAMRLEERLLCEDSLYEQILILEEELIDDYLDGTLTDHDKQNFERYFMAAPERFQKLESARALRRRLAARKTHNAQPQISRPKSWAWLFRPFPALTSLKAAAAMLLVMGAGFAGWRIFFYQSDAEKNLAVLKQAYGAQRTVEARIVEFEHVPLTRGKSDRDSAATLARDRAERLLLDAVAENKNAANLHALGKFYLAERSFDKALPLFEEAAKLAPNDAKLFSDFGAAMLEAGKKASNENDGAKSLEALAKSLSYLEKAVSLDPRLPEPRFNRALCLEAMFLPAQARAAWNDYLILDSNSPWASEAKQRLQNLESQKNESRSAAELERDFLEAFRRQNEDEAWHLLNVSRELFREKYLPQRLAASFLRASGSEQDELLRAMLYAGAIEKKRIGDFFAEDLAQFYARQPPAKLEPLKIAQKHALAGYQLAVEGKSLKAFEQFEKARVLFSAAGNVQELKLVEFALGYCMTYIERVDESLLTFRQIADFSTNRKYKWLEFIALQWYSGSLWHSRRYTEAMQVSKKLLPLVEEIQSPLLLQQQLTFLARLNAFVGQNAKALDNLQRMFKISFENETGLGQKNRNLHTAAEVMSAIGLDQAAQVVALENVKLTENFGNPVSDTSSRYIAGMTYSRAGRFDEARKWFAESLEKAKAVEDEFFRGVLETESLLNLAHTERQAGDFEKAARLYDEALKFYEPAKMHYELYESQKGRLLTYLALGNAAELEKQIPATLEIADKFREEIREEQERNSFFDHEQSIYDIAIDYEFQRGRYERAFDYTEKSNSRSLNDWLRRGAEISDGKKDLEILLNGNAELLPLTSIREQMPERAQILQYSVLPDKTLIWLVAKENFAVVETKIGSDALRLKVETFLRLVQTDSAATAEIEVLQRELFDLLILPISPQLDSSREIYIVPHKILFHLPFAALRAPSGKTLLEDFNLSYSPSANVFLICTQNARRKNVRAATEALLSVGNPAFDRRDSEDLLDLPAAESEAREIADFYEIKRTLIGKQATKTAFLDSSQTADVIHFAGHYVVAPGLPLTSRLMLAKNDRESAASSNLTNAELIRQKLPNTKLVVLSACQTGIENYYNGEGLVGLSRTFLVAGAPLVVASQWKVDSEATAELMKKFHFYRRRENLSTAAALRRAQLDLATAPGGRFRRPYFWAAFAVYGGYAEF